MLQQVFQPLTSGENVILHLVCAQKPGFDKTETKQEFKSDVSSGASGSGHNTNSSNSDGNTARVTPQNNGIDPRLGYPPLNYPYMMNGMMPGVPMYPMFYTPEQMAQMQQLYSQFMAQFPGMNPLVNGGVPLAGTVAPQVPITNPGAEIAPPPDVPQAAAPRIDAGQAAGADMDADDEENRDWLDMFYWMSRAVVLFSIVYFYSSPTRFLAVIAIAITMYLYQAGIIFNRAPNVRPPARRAAVPVPAAPQEEEPRGEQVQPVMGDNMRRGQTVAVTPQTEQLSGLRLFWVIVSSLFTSLIPEAAPANFN